jgi:hypothetical protein
MKIIKYIKLAVIGLVISSINMSFTPPAPAAGLSAIINASVSNKEMTLADLKSFLKGAKTRWSDNSKVTLAFVEPTSEVGGKVAKAIFGTTGSEMNKMLLALAFQGKITPPKYFGTESELVNYIKSTAGSIGVVTSGGTGSATVAKIDGATSF